MATYTPANASEIITQIGQAVSGDVVNLPTGSHDCRQVRFTITGWVGVAAGNTFRAPSVYDPGNLYYWSVRSASVDGSGNGYIIGVPSTAGAPNYSAGNRWVWPVANSYRVRTGSGSTFNVTAVADVPLSPAAGVTINGYASGTTIWAAWLIDGGGSANAITIAGNQTNKLTLKFDGIGTPYGAIHGCCDLRNGTINLTDVAGIGPVQSSTPGVVGGTIRNMFTCNATTHATKVTMRRCSQATLTDAADQGITGDAVSTKATSAALGQASWLKLYSNTGSGNGYGQSDQLITAHEDFSLDDYGGYYSGLVGYYNVATPGTNISGGLAAIRLHGTRVVGGNVINCALIEDCLFESSATNVTCCVQYGVSPGVRLLGTVRRSKFIGQGSQTYGMMFIKLGTADSLITIENCRFENPASPQYGIILVNYTGAVRVYNCTATTTAAHYWLYVLASSGAANVDIRNNVTLTSMWTNSVYVTGSSVTLTGGNNTWGKLNSGFAGTNDLVAVADVSAMDSTPISSGNCDSNGDPTVTFTIDKDYLGRPRFYYPDGATKTICRGAVALDTLSLPTPASVLANSQVGNGQAGTLKPYRTISGVGGGF